MSRGPRRLGPLPGGRAAGGTALTAAVLAVQVGLVPLPAPLDPIALGMAMLALACTVLVGRSARRAPAAVRWRWQAALAGWAMWTAQWSVNVVEQWMLNGEQFVSSVVILLSRIAFVAAMAPLAVAEPGRAEGRAGPPRALRWLDAGLAALFASLLAMLSWPGFEDAAIGDPDRFFLYFGYGAMAALAALSLATQRGTIMASLSRAMLATFLLYGAAAIGLREAFVAGLIDSESPWFLTGDLGFVAALILLPGRRYPPPPADAGEQITETGLAAQLVPLLLALMVVGLAFAAASVAPLWGVGAGLVALLGHAARTALTDRHHRRQQERAIASERARSGTMIDFMHEVRSPLGVVAINAGLLRRTDRLSAGQEELCTAIENGCAAVSRLLDDMLSLERLEAGLIPPRVEPCDLAAVADEVVALLAPRWRGAGVDVSVATPRPFRAPADREAVHRILLNLVDNAVRFTPAGGQVTVRLTRPDGATVLTVEDSGVGMDAARQARLFHRFAVVGSPLHGARGTGLGLSISRALARGMGGDITVRSAPGRGTAMQLWLP